MKRRGFVKKLVALPVAPALVAQEVARRPATPAANPAPQSGPEASGLETTVSDAVAEMMPRFFTAEQFSALRHLSGILMPPFNGTPGALDAQAPEFLDFLIGQSLPDRQQLYRTGLDRLNAQAKKQFKKAFAEVDADQAALLLAPLREAWTPEPPTDPLARFLRAVKQDVRTATMNSREWSAAGATSGGRRASGFNLYWYPID